MNQDTKIKEFWDSQAHEFGAADLATAPDHAYRELEISKIIPHIRGPRVLDVGCGNGYSTFAFERHYPDIKFVGVDYSQKMILAASAEVIHKHSNVAFITGDVRHLSSRPFYNDSHTPKFLFDTIISERCIINLMTWEEQQAALLEMEKCLTPDGRLILVENFIDGLSHLNRLRKQFGLHEIKVRWHNRYLQSIEFHNFIEGIFHIKHQENIGNMYYIASRVIYAAMCKELGLGDPQYEHPINYIAAKLPSFGEHWYSPNMLYVLTPK